MFSQSLKRGRFDLVFKLRKYFVLTVPYK